MWDLGTKRKRRGFNFCRQDVKGREYISPQHLPLLTRLLATSIQTVQHTQSIKTPLYNSPSSILVRDSSSKTTATMQTKIFVTFLLTALVAAAPQAIHPDGCASKRGLDRVPVPLDARV